MPTSREAVANDLLAAARGKVLHYEVDFPAAGPTSAGDGHGLSSEHCSCVRPAAAEPLARFAQYRFRQLGPNRPGDCIGDEAQPGLRDVLADDRQAQPRRALVEVVRAYKTGGARRHRPQLPVRSYWSS